MNQVKSVAHILAALSLLIFVLSACVAPTDAPNRASGAADILHARKVIALVSNAENEQATRTAASAEGYRELDTATLGALGLTMLTFEMPLDVTGAEAIELLETAVPGSVVGINHAYRLQQQSSGATSLDYANAMMRWPDDGCRAQSPIGLIDTGLNTSSPSLAPARVITRRFFDGTAGDTVHGTEVATVLVDANRLQDVTLYAANVFGQEENLGLVAGADALIKALDWLAQQNVQFVNLALAGPYNKLLDLAVERAASNGMILVAAVGNNGPNVEPMYPAGFPDVIAVTAVDINGNIYRNAVRGPHVDIAAPGVDILVNSGNGARFVSGTSIATPLVTARLVADGSLKNKPSIAQVRNRLRGKSTDLGARGRDPTFGNGLVLAEDVCGG